MPNRKRSVPIRLIMTSYSTMIMTKDTGARMAYFTATPAFQEMRKKAMTTITVWWRM